jgi:hypothetical protein
MTHGGTTPRAMHTHQVAAMQAAGRDKSLNVGLSAVQPSHQHHLQLCHTQAQPEALKHPLRRAQA